MSFLSRIMKPIVRKSINQRTPMPPSRKGGLAGLIQRVKDERLDPPISIGGVGGGVGITKSPLQETVEKIQNSIQAVPVPPGQEGQLPMAPVNRPIPRPSIGGAGGGFLPKPPERIPPQDFGFGPGIRPTEIRGPDGRIIGPAGVTPPDFIKNIENKGPGSLRDRIDLDRFVPPQPPGAGRDPLRYDSIGMPLVNPNMPIGDGSTRRPQPGEPGATPIVPPARTSLSDRVDIYGEGKRYDPANLPEGFSFDTPSDGIYNMAMPPPGFVYAYGPDGERRAVPSGEPGAAEMRDRPSFSFGPGGLTPPPPTPPQDSNMIAELPPERIAEIGDPIPVTDPVTPTVDPVTTAPTPSATTEQGTDPIQSMSAPVGALDPVLLGQTSQENLSDPLVRALYFGTQDQPGFYQQLQQAGANLIGQDVPLQQTAGLTPLELLARQQAVAGLGGFEPFFQQNKDLIDQAIGQSRRAEALRDPYFNRAERQMQIGLGDELRGINEARGITTEATDRFGRSLGRLGRQQIGATGAFGQRMGDIEAGAQRATDIFGRDLDATQAGLTGQVDEFGNRLTDVEGLQRGATDIFGQGVEASQRGLGAGVDQFGNRLTDVEGLQAGATDQFGRRLSDVEARGEGAAGRFGQSLGGIEAGAIGSTDIFGSRLGESEDLIRGTLGGYDQGLTQQFYNPFEDRVVQQTIDDVLEAGDKQDIAARAREISSGAFGGSRARLGAMERREALGEGLAKALGNIRQQGFSEAQRTGLSEFARQREAERAASSGLSGLASTRLGAESSLFDRLTTGAQQRLAAEQGVVDLLGRTGQQQLGAQQQLANLLQSTAGERLGATRGLEEFRRSGAGQQLAAQQQLANSLQSTAGQRLGAGQSLAEFQRGTAGQQLASQQALQNLLQSSAGQQLGAQQQLGSTLRGLTGDQFGAQQQLAANLMGYGAAGAGARQNLASGLLGIGQQRGAGAAALGQQLAGYGSQIGDVGSVLDTLRRGERSELSGYGATGRGIAETGLSRIYQQQLGQQQRPLSVLGQIGSMLPGYQQTSTQIGSQYGLPTDPSAAGLGAAFSAYGALAPRQGQG